MGRSGRPTSPASLARSTSELNKLLRGQETSLQANPLWAAKSRDLQTTNGQQPWFLCTVPGLAQQSFQKVQVHESPQSPTSPYRHMRPGSIPWAAMSRPSSKAPSEDLRRSQSGPQLLPPSPAHAAETPRSEPVTPRAAAASAAAASPKHTTWGSFPWLPQVEGSMLPRNNYYHKCGPAPDKLGPHSHMYKSMGSGSRSMSSSGTLGASTGGFGLTGTFSSQVGAAEAARSGKLPGGYHHETSQQNGWDSVTHRQMANLACHYRQPMPTEPRRDRR